jgi:hypothetical protein
MVVLLIIILGGENLEAEVEGVHKRVRSSTCPFSRQGVFRDAKKLSRIYS